MFLENSTFCKGLYDSGSNISIINKRMLEFLNLSYFKVKKPEFKMVSGQGKVIGITKLKIKIFNITRTVFVFVLDSPDFSHDFLVGLDLIYEFGLCQDNNLKIFQNTNRKQSREPHSCNNFYVHSVNKCNLETSLSHLSSDKQSAIHQLITDYNKAFATSKFDVGGVRGHKAHIKMSEHRYISRKPYRCNVIDQREIESQVNQLLEAGLIEESTSPFAAPVTLAVKKQADGSKKKNRLCIDYTALNKLIVPESQPFPHIEDLITKARDCQWYSVIDINSAFWSIPLREKDRYKTAFVTQTGHYNWKCLPFGLKTSPAIFQRILRNTLKKYGLDDFAVNYIDDILIFSKTFKEHLDHLKKLIYNIYLEGFRLSLAKCEFAQSKVKYLGHIIENNSTTPVFDNVVPLRNFPVPKTQKNVRQFLGKINFYHAYIPNAASLLAPLHHLLKKNVKFIWSDDCQQSFQTCINLLCSHPCLSIFCPEKDTFVYTDASNEGIGAVLKQRQSDGSIKPVAFFSKKISDSHKKKRAIFLECLAIKESLLYWRHKLLGLKFKIFTDHKPLVGKKVNSQYDDELRELLLHISQFDFVIEYKPGIENTEADCLSRNPVLEHDENFPDLKIVNFIDFSHIKADQKDNLENIKKFKDTFEENGLIFSNVKKKKRILISEKFAKELIENAHFYYGHIGAQQLQYTLFPYFYVKNFSRLIKVFCQHCSTCIRNKTRIPAHYGLLSHLGPATRPFEYMSVDTIGGFSGYHSSHKYIHLLVDHFTRFAYVLTSKTQTASDFKKLLNLVLKDGNKIENLLADQYASLNSTEFKNFVNENNIKLLYTAVDCPFSNGLNERLNQTLVNRLRCKINENDVNKKKSWSVLVNACVEEYNNTIHSVTRFAPNYLLTGVVPKFLQTLKMDLSNFNLTLDRKRALDNSIKNHQQNEKYYNQTRTNITFSDGDMVYINHGNSLNRNKLDSLRTGPFKILKKISNVMYLVDSGIRRSESNVFHVSKLYPYKPPP